MLKILLKTLVYILFISNIYGWGVESSFQHKNVEKMLKTFDVKYIWHIDELQYIPMQPRAILLYIKVIKSRFGIQQPKIYNLVKYFHVPFIYVNSCQFGFCLLLFSALLRRCVLCCFLAVCNIDNTYKTYRRGRFTF